MARKGQGSGGRSFEWSDPAAIAGIIVLFLIAMWVTWYLAHEQISTVYVYWRYFMLWPINFIANYFDLPGLSSIQQWVNEVCAPNDGWKMCTRDFSNMTWGEISKSSLVFNGITLAILLYWCFKMFKKVDKEHPDFLYGKTHSLNSFVSENTKLYPHLKLFSNIDLVAKPIDDPVFGMSLTSRQFAYKYGLISGWQETNDGDQRPIIDRELTRKIFLDQLGKLWTRSADLSPGETLLFAMVIPRVAATDALMEDDKFKQALADSDGLIKWCWDCFEPPSKNKSKKSNKKDKQTTNKDDAQWLKPTFDLGYAREIISKYIRHPNVVEIISSHAYVRTILYACYVKATSLGVFPPADVRWMRFYDRELWYLRSSIGRQVAFAEGGAAVYSHYLYESKAGYAIVDPQLDKAVNALVEAVDGFKYTEKDKENWENSRKLQLATNQNINKS